MCFLLAGLLQRLESHFFFPRTVPMTTTTKTPRVDVYTRVTNRIIEQLSQGVKPWLKPWNAEHAAGRITRPLRSNGEPYRGINVLMLWDSAEVQGFACPIWMTFQQAKQFGGHVKKGEHATPIAYASTFTKPEINDAGEVIDAEVPFLKEYSVFNAEQCEGLPERFHQLRQEPNSTIERIAGADAFFRNTGAVIEEGGNQAFYSITRDVIRMPRLETFRDAESHAATLAHELTHWTRHATRLDRDLGRKRFADAGYAMEELVAELGSAYFCADLAITPEDREDHAAYIETWLKVLQDDKKAVFSAASHASKAVDFLHSLQPNATEPAAEELAVN
jgi:antirestriction protein ArdC